MSALEFYAKICGYQDYTLDFCIRRMLEGWFKEKVHALDSRVPISPAILKKLQQQWVGICIYAFWQPCLGQQPCSYFLEPYE